MAVTIAYDRTDLFSLVRGTKGWRFDPVGTLADVATNEVRIDHDPATLAWRGWLVEDAATNLLTNPGLVGATSGVIGAGGAYPTGMTLSGAAGMAVQIVGSGTEEGWPYLDIRFSGTTTSGGFPDLVETATITASIGQSYAAEGRARVVAGSLPAGWSLRVILAELNTSTQLNLTSVTSSLTGEASLRTAAVPVSRTLNQATVNRVRLGYRIGTPGSGQSIDVTLRLGGVRLYRSTILYSPAFPPNDALAPFARAADDLELFNISRWFDPTQGTFCIDFMPGQTTAPVDRGLLLLDDGTTDNRIRLRMLAASTNVRLSVDGAGAPIVATLDTTSGAALTRHTVRFSYGPAGYVLSVNGAAPVTASGAVPDGLARVLLGRSLTSSEYLNGWLGPRFDYFPQQYTDTAAADGFTIRNR